jgi:hypothetical protein
MQCQIDYEEKISIILKKNRFETHMLVKATRIRVELTRMHVIFFFSNGRRLYLQLKLIYVL